MATSKIYLQYQSNNIIINKSLFFNLVQLLHFL